MEIDNKLLGRAIARFREMRGLTQAQLNERIGMSTIQHIEQGRNTVSLRCLNRIATALNVPAACITLLGSRVEKSDKIHDSLRRLVDATLKLSVPAATRPARKSVRKTTRRTRKSPAVA